MVRSYEVNVCEWELRCKTITVTARSPGDAMFEAMDRYTPKPADCAARREGFYGMNGVPRLGRKHMEIVQGYPVCRSIYLSRLGFLVTTQPDLGRPLAGRCVSGLGSRHGPSTIVPPRPA